MNVMIVEDDDATIRRLTHEIEQIPDVETWEYRKPSAALRAVKNSPSKFSHAVIDLLFIGQTDGFTLAESILQIAPDLKVIFYTAYDVSNEPELKARLEVLGDIVVKGRDRLEGLKRVRRLIEQG